jgi:hypothetical protein
LAALRNQTFFSVQQANEAILPKQDEYNSREPQRGQGSRTELWKAVDLPALGPLPERRFEPFESATKTLQIDYHVIVCEHHYSAPYIYIGKKLEVRWTASTVEMFLQGRRIAVHVRSYQKWGWTTCREHRPEHHNAQADWSVERMVNWAQKIGPSAGQVTSRMLHAHDHYERGLKGCLGLLRLGKTYGDARLEAGCQRALALGAASYRTVKAILESGTDRMPLPETVEPAPRQLPLHDNIRGADYYA